MRKKNRFKFLDMGRINPEMLKVTEYTQKKMYGEIWTNRTVSVVSILMLSSITSKSIATS